MAKTSDSPGARLAAMRRTFSGGRPPTCNCGECAKCKKREAMRRYRAGPKPSIKNKEDKLSNGSAIAKKAVVAREAKRKTANTTRKAE